MAEAIGNFTLALNQFTGKSCMGNLACIRDQVWQISSEFPDRVALLDVDGSSLTYRELRLRVVRFAETLRQEGIRAEDRIAVVLPNCPDTIVVLLAIMCVGIALPLDPGLRLKEFETYFTQFGIRRLLTIRGLKSAAVEAANRLKLGVIELNRTTEADPSDIADSRFPEETVIRLKEVALLLGTSGSTALPKIVPLTHENLSVSAKEMSSALQLTSADRCLCLMPLFHRSGLSATFCSLITGGSVVFPFAFSAVDFFEWMSRFSPTWYSGVPAMHRSILARAKANQSTIQRHPFRFIRSSASPLPVELFKELRAVLSAPVIQTYGTTETGVISATPFTCPDQKIGSCGFQSCEAIAILNEKGEKLPAGEIGEVAVRGANVMSGYENNPDANREAFIDGWFRTGDLGYLDSENYLFVHGRMKETINRGGEKISPFEVQETLLRHPAVVEAAVLAIPDPMLNETVGCAIVPREGSLITPQEIQRFVANHLADHKVPPFIVFRSSLPILRTGKLNRTELLRSFMEEAASDQESHAPSSQVDAIQSKILSIWKSVLRISDVQAGDRFLQLGGDSLMATQLVNRLQEEFEIDLSIKTVFTSTTVRQQAQYVAEALNNNRPKRAPICPVPQAEYYPLSFPQQRLWFLYQLASDSPVYNIAKVVRIRGALNRAALENALKIIVARHESLRTRFISVDGTPYQKVGDWPLEIPFINVSDLNEEEAETKIDELAQQEARRAFRLENETLFRATLLKKSHLEHVLLLINHHIVSDRWSTGLFFDEFQHFYEMFADGRIEMKSNDCISDFPIPIQYRDFAIYQRQIVEDPDFAEQLSYWKQKLSSPPVLALPARWSTRSPVDFRGEKESLILPQSLIEAIHSFCRQEEATPFMFYLTVLQTLLHRYTDQQDILVGTPISGRFRIETEKLLGFFANTIVLRADFSGNPTFREILAKMRKVVIEAFANQEVPFEKVVETINPLRSGGHSPLFDVVLTVVQAENKIAFSELKLEIRSLFTGTTKFPLRLSVEETVNGLMLCFHFSTSLFEKSFITQFLSHLGILMESALQDPDNEVARLSVLSMLERRRLLSEWNQSSSNCFTGQAVHKVFEETVTRMEEAIALRSGAIQWTYKELNSRANVLAHHLRSLGVSEETPVGVAMERSPDAIVSLLGILKAGGAYVPLDTNYPEERLQYLINDARLQTVITQERLVPQLSHLKVQLVSMNQGWPDKAERNYENLSCGSNGESLCYIMYTSGSTGKPKGVCILHRGVLRIAKGLDFLNLTHEDRILQNSTLSFDASTFEIWSALLNGALLVIPEKPWLSLGELGHEIADKKITTLWLTSALFSEMVEAESDRMKGLRYLLAGGDVLSFKHVEMALKNLPDTKVINGYGPTECTTFSCCYVVSSLPDDSVPIGRPIANTSVYVLDQKLEPVPVGIIGQLYIGDDGLARGYLNDADLTESKFIGNPFSSNSQSRLYATGDAVRWQPDGNLQFVGRIDQQVKIRGFRVEPGEIESAILQHSSVRNCAVVTNENDRENKQLVAYVVAEKELRKKDLFAFLQLKLPRYMIPAHIVLMDALPLTSGGKLDRKSLPEPILAVSDQLQKGHVVPRDPLEAQLAEIWKRLLNLKSVGVTDDFFDLGGHSLLAAKLYAQIEKRIGKALPLSTLFTNPTIEGLAGLLRSSNDTQDEHLLVPIQSDGSGAPFFCVHGVGGQVLLGYREIAKHLGTDQPFYAIQTQGLDGKKLLLSSVEDMATAYLNEIRNLQKKGPYYIGGACFGGVVAFEMARQLLDSGEEVGLLALFDASARRWSRRRSRVESLRMKATYYVQYPFYKMKHLAVKGFRIWKRLIHTNEKTGRSLLQNALGMSGADYLNLRRRLRKIRMNNYSAMKKYRPGYFNGGVTLFRASMDGGDSSKGWTTFCENVEVFTINGDHKTMLKPPNVIEVAKQLKTCLEKAKNHPNKRTKQERNRISNL